MSVEEMETSIRQARLRERYSEIDRLTDYYRMIAWFVAVFAMAMVVMTLMLSFPYGGRITLWRIITYKLGSVQFSTISCIDKGAIAGLATILVTRFFDLCWTKFHQTGRFFNFIILRISKVDTLLFIFTEAIGAVMYFGLVAELRRVGEVSELTENAMGAWLGYGYAIVLLVILRTVWYTIWRERNVYYRIAACSFVEDD